MRPDLEKGSLVIVGEFSLIKAVRNITTGTATSIGDSSMSAAAAVVVAGSNSITR